MSVSPSVLPCVTLQHLSHSCSTESVQPTHHYVQPFVIFFTFKTHSLGYTGSEFCVAGKSTYQVLYSKLLGATEPLGEM